MILLYFNDLYFVSCVFHYVMFCLFWNEDLEMRYHNAYLRVINIGLFCILMLSIIALPFKSFLKFRRMDRNNKEN